jgi:uncharacterized spore protein YtfJ
MIDLKGIMSLIGERLKTLARSNAVVSKPISVGNRHVLPLCELSLSFGGGGGTGEGLEKGEQHDGQGTGGGAGGSAKAVPVAVVVVDGSDVRIETFGK